MAATKPKCCLLFLTILAVARFSITQAYPAPPLVPGLSYDFYDSRCPDLEDIVQSQIATALQSNIGLAAALLRIHFHDCFVQGCDGSVLLDGANSEKTAPPNTSLRPAAFALINSIRATVEKACGRIVSCADIAALAARDSVYLSGGPDYLVPLGRRDGFAPANLSTIFQFLPAPTSKTSELIGNLSQLNLDVNDLVALSGGHTIGIGHCGSFEERLYPTQDPTMNQFFANTLKGTCPRLGATNTTVLDIRTPNVFDNKYYVDLMNRQGLFTSDQDLYQDKRTKDIVTSFAVDQDLFFDKFAFSVVKMGMLNVLTGNQGEIRANCGARNSKVGLESVVDGDNFDRQATF